jgi:hypothetical protein
MICEECQYRKKCRQLHSPLVYDGAHVECMEDDEHPGIVYMPTGMTVGLGDDGRRGNVVGVKVSVVNFKVRWWRRIFGK